MGSKTLTLKEPIEQGSEKITEFVIRKPKGKDFRSMPMEPKVGDMLNLLGKLVGHPPSVIDELGAEDMVAAMEIVGGFIPGGLVTGGKA